MPTLTVIMIDPGKQEKADIKDRVKYVEDKIKSAIETVKSQSSASEKPTILVVCPEYTFVKHHDDQTRSSYTQTEKTQIERAFKLLSAKHPDVYIVPGTGMFQKKAFDLKDPDKKEKYEQYVQEHLNASRRDLISKVEVAQPGANDPGINYEKTLKKVAKDMPVKNTATMYHGGSVLATYSKQNPHIEFKQSNRGFMHVREPARLFYPGHGESIFTLPNNLRVGVEICADHANSALVNALNKDESKQGLDIHLMLSNTMQVRKENIASSPGKQSILINCSGFFAGDDPLAKQTTGIWLVDDTKGDKQLTKLKATKQGDDVLVFTGIPLPDHKLKLDVEAKKSDKPEAAPELVTDAPRRRGP